MDKYTQRFLRILVLSGLPFGGIWVVFFSIEYGGIVGITIGSLIGFFFGLFVAYFEMKDFSKPTYAINLQISNDSAEPIKTNFQLQNSFSANPLLWTLGVVFIAMVITTQPQPIFQALFVVILGLSTFLWNAIKRGFSRLSIYSDRMEFTFVFYKLKVVWDEIEQIERRGKNWFIVCRSSEVTAHPLLKNWIKAIEADKRIFLNEFASNFLESELAKAILEKSNQIKIVST